MRSIFDNIRAKGAPAVVELWDTKTQESLQLEFKQKANGSHGQPESADYNNLSKTLSAFANSAGGLLLWGVRTEKHGKGAPDAASKGAAIANLSLFASEMRRAVGEALMPRHDGIEVLDVEDPQNPGTGYLAIWVERSERRPHRAERANEKYYFKRSGSNTYAMEHYDIEDAFNRVAPTELRLVSGKAVKTGERTKDNYRTLFFSVGFSLHNDSRLSAAAPYAWIDGIKGASIEYLPFDHLKRRGEGGRTIISGDATTYVHPGFPMPIFNAQIPIGHYLGSDRFNHDGNMIHDSKVTIIAGVGCQNAPARKVVFEWAGAALEDFLQV